MKMQWRFFENKTKVIFFCSLANFINAADRVLMPVAIVTIAENKKWSLNEQGWILSSFAIGYLTSQVLLGNAGKKYGSRKVLCLAVFLWSISTIATPFLTFSIPLIIIARLMLGFGEGLGLPTIFQLFSQHIPPEQISRAFGYMISAGSIGQTFALIVAPYLEWHLSFLLFGTFGILWTIAWNIFYKDNELYNRKADEENILEENKNELLCITQRKYFSYWCLWAIYIAHFAMNWSNYIIMQWLPTYLSRTLGADTQSISLTAIPYIVSSFCGVGWAHLADHLLSIGYSMLKIRRFMTFIGLFGPAVCLVVFPEVSNLIVAVLLISLAMGLCAANSSGHLSNFTDVAPNHAGITFAVSNTLATIPGILCGPLTAALVTSSSGRWFPVFLLAGVINFTAAIIYQSHSSVTPIL